MFCSLIVRFFLNKLDSKSVGSGPNRVHFRFGWIYTSPEEDEGLVLTRPGQPRAPPRPGESPV